MGNLRDDVSRLEIVHTDAMQWSPSPMAGVERKRLERSGPEEAGRVTSVVRYAPGSSFRSHPHPQGEEILVLSGVFSDERGDHPAGTYLLNPEGFEHAPRSAPGCELFVKLRQYPGEDALRVDNADVPWVPHPTVDGVARRPLYEGPDATVHLLQFLPGASAAGVVMPKGEELFVLEGSFEDEHGHYRAGSWVRFPPGARHSPRSRAGFVAYVKKDHLAG